MFNIWKFQLKIIAGKRLPTDVFDSHCIVLNGHLYTKDLLPEQFSPPGSNYTELFSSQVCFVSLDWVRTERKLVPVALKVTDHFLPECLVATSITLQ